MIDINNTHVKYLLSDSLDNEVIKRNIELRSLTCVYPIYAIMEYVHGVFITLNILALLLMIVAMATPGWMIFSLDLGEEKLDIGVNPYYYSVRACTTDTYMGSTSTKCVSKEHDLSNIKGKLYIIMNTSLSSENNLEFSSNNYSLNTNNKRGFQQSFKSRRPYVSCI